MAKKGFVDIIKDIFKGPPGPSRLADQKMDRRRFFRAGLAEMFKPLDAAIRPLEHAARELGRLDSIESSPPKYRTPPVVDRPWLRPPGAMPEGEFRSRCTRCNDCVTACPANAIRIDWHDGQGAGYPYIEPDEHPCVLCDGQPCMPACPTGALQITPLASIDMGTANFFEQSCVRTHGDPCTSCVDHCPVGTAALELLDGKVHVIPEGCTGCGVCQNHCPTDPKSIIVIPKSAREIR